MENLIAFLSCLFVVVQPWQAIAQSDGDVRLVGGSSPLEGRVEIYHSSKWGTVCDDYWDIVDASVVCRQLGYNHAFGAPDRAYFGQGESNQLIWLDNVKCRGDEKKLSSCTSNGWGVTNCGHQSDAGVRCVVTQVLEGAVRLSDGALLEEGRVEIYHAGQWGTICNDYWGKDEARVVCYQLGYSGYKWAEADYGDGTGPIHLDNLNCYGAESALMYCPHSSWGVHNCGHNEDVGVRCYRPGSSPNRMSWWLISIIVASMLCLLGLVIGIISRCCKKRKRSRDGKNMEVDPASADPMLDTSAPPVQTFVTVDPAAAVSIIPLQPYPPAQGVQPYPPAQGVQPYPPAQGVQPYPPTQGVQPYPPAQGVQPYPPAQGGMPQLPSNPPTYNQSQSQPAAQPQPTDSVAGQPAAQPQPTEVHPDGLAAGEHTAVVHPEDSAGGQSSQ